MRRQPRLRWTLDAVTDHDPTLPSAHAGVVTRLMAACVDAVAVLLVTVAVDLGAAGIRFAWSPMNFRWPRPPTQIAVMVLLVAAVLYLTAGWAVAGRTYGGRLLGLRVLSARYGVVRWPRAFVRALAYVLFPVGLLWSGISATRRSLQDLVLRTVVVYDVGAQQPARIPRPRRPASGGVTSPLAQTRPAESGRRPG
jgi:uncharacterized RDD family membrane protein YckC